MWSGGSSEPTLLRALPLLIALALSACADDRSAASPVYREGFDDGCASAGTQDMPGGARPIRNAALYQGDKDYRAGWTSGFSTCRMTPSRF